MGSFNWGLVIFYYLFMFFLLWNGFYAVFSLENVLRAFHFMLLIEFELFYLKVR